MWDKITKQLSKYESAVLTGRDAQGYPFSVRCMPQVDIHAQMLRVQLPPGVLLQPGPASLLCHRHNELLWDMESFLLRGNLVQVQDEQGWNFLPQQFIPGTPGTGVGAIISSLRWLLTSRQSARRYLEKRNLPRPSIPWSEIMEVKEQARRSR
ncbi:MAG TPA: hypothetical protein VK667_14560 [Ktedonobacteraceae bacterium]|jgi:hypothetical protein|nr:hypothetical protein [Ktedonobacteraceae bacterium]